MKSKNWRLQLHRDHIAVTLFTVTTDAMTNQDLRQPPEQSLIHVARQFHRHGQTDDQNHRDLAIGALMAYAAEPLYDRDDTHIEQADEVPSRPPNRFVGGSGENLVPIWEEVTGSAST